MPGAEDDVHWGDELKSLPSWIRSLVVSVRLGGLILVVMGLGAVIVGQSLGMFNDQASQERRALLQSNAEISRQAQANERHLLDVQANIERQLQVMEKHVATTEAISRSQCLFIPRLSDRERQACMNGHSWQ